MKYVWLLILLVGSARSATDAQDVPLTQEEKGYYELKKLVDLANRSVVKIENSNGSWGSGYCAWSKGGQSLIVTAGHVVLGPGKLAYSVRWWDGSGPWKSISARLIYAIYSPPKDVAILIIDKELPVLPTLARNGVNSAKYDEILIADCQAKAPPALLAVGVVEERKEKYLRFTGWAWYGHSGAPAIRRKDGKVISIVAWPTAGHAEDAAESAGPDHNLIRDVLDPEIETQETKLKK